MINLTFYCNTEGNTGFGKHARELSLELNKICNLRLIGTYKPEMNRELKPCFEKKAFEETDYALILAPPMYWETIRRNHTFSVGYGIFEGTKIPTGWAKNCEDLDLVIVPSNHTREAFESQMDKKDFNKIKVIPHGVNKTIYNNKVKPNPKLMNEFKGKFKFLFVGGWSQGMNDRKGAQFLLKAFNDEFGKEEKVLLIMKYNMSYCNKEHIDKQIKILKMRKEGAEIIQIFEELSEEDLASLYASCDCVVSPHMSESWGMAMSEAISVGKPLIATNYGGVTDFGNSGINSHLIKGVFVPVISEPKNYYEEAEWMCPDKDELQKALRNTFNGKIKFDMRENLIVGWDETAKLIIKEMEKLK